ncbi:hypothetical protein [Georgenia thermotolerans]|uniref:Uncharacterized protein n=1 Tax=Georgenia thermotolerans TaxID=527326 RepID=A0A7J5US95_9MICO|nr:hypothetical protein [Georgenia thermotolerans]KAE8765249.1 hypothetical protein GB883_04775 [Georgenia thermotolerans]
MRSFIRRFGELEREVAAVRGSVGDLHHAVSEVRGSVEGLIQQHSAALEARLDAGIRRVNDSANYAARRAPLTRRRIRVLFLVHHIEAWDSSDALVRALREEADFEVVVASIPRRFRGMAELGQEEAVHAGLEERGVAHIRITLADDRDRLSLVRAVDPDIIFRQSQWDADVPEAFSTENLRFARLCLVPYETINIVQNMPMDGVTNSAVDTEFHRAAWMVFCASELNRQVAERDGMRGGAQFVVTGHPKADHLRSVEPRWPIVHEGRRPRARVVWSAHHTILDDWTNFGVFHLVADDMLEWARSAPDVDFVFMQHPALPPVLNDPASPLTPDQAAEFRAAWDALPNTAVLAGGDYGPVLAASDLMIVDGLSMLVEYQFMGKPLIHIERPGHRPFNEIGEIVMRGAHTVPGVASARRLAEDFFDGAPDPLEQVQRETITRLFGDEPSVSRIVAALRDALVSELAR